MVEKQVVTPEGLAPPVGYSHAIAVEGGRTVYLAGQTAMDETGEIVAPGDIGRQFEQALANLKVAVEAGGGTMTDIVKLNLFVTDVGAYKANLKPIGQTYRSFFGKYFPAMTLVQVAGLFDPAAMIEIEGMAVVEA